MQVTLLTICLTVLVKATFSSPVDLPLNLQNNIDIQTILTQEVPKNNLTVIISDIIGLDLVNFSELAKNAALELLQVVSMANKRYEEISGEASPDFKVEIGKIISKTIARFSSVYERVTNTIQSLPQNSSLGIVIKNTEKAIARLQELDRSSNVSKEAVEAIIGEFLDTTFTSTIRDELRYSKVIIEILFIIDEANVAVTKVIAKEKPEFAEKIQVLVNDIERAVMTSVRPILDLLSPLFLSDLNI